MTLPGSSRCSCCRCLPAWCWPRFGRGDAHLESRADHAQTSDGCNNLVPRCKVNPYRLLPWGRSVDLIYVRSAAFSCAFACGALVVGPGMVGTAVAHAGPFGIGPDIDFFDLFGDDDHKKKSDQHHPRPGSADVGAQTSRTAAGITAAEAGPPTAKIGSVPEGVGSVPEGVGVTENISRGGGGGGMPRVVGTGRSANLPRVPSAPVTRSVVIRGAPPAAAAGLPTQTLPQTPVVISLATPPPSPQLPEGRPTPAGPPTSAPSSHAKDPLAPRLPGVARVPDSFRIGYAEYLRSATTTDLSSRRCREMRVSRVSPSSAHMPDTGRPGPCRRPCWPRHLRASCCRRIDVVVANNGYSDKTFSDSMGGKRRSVSGPLIRSAIGCAIACGALTVGPLVVGSPVAKADLLGVGGGGGGVDVLGIKVVGSGESERSGSGGPTTGGVSRSTGVSTAPSTRSVVIRANRSAAQPDQWVEPAASALPVAYAPAVALSEPKIEAVPAAPPLPAAVPLVMPPSLPAAPPVRLPEPEALPIPATIEPGPGRHVAPADSYPQPAEIADSFRVGYAEYLRAATTSDIVFAALPGVAGIAGFTILGAYAGYRQAHGVQAALLAPVPTRILL